MTNMPHSADLIEASNGEAESECFAANCATWYTETGRNKYRPSEWMSAVCTLLPSRRSQHSNGAYHFWTSLSRNIAHAVTLPRYQHKMHDHIAINLRRQLSSASHRQRHLPSASKKSKKHSFQILKKPGGIEVGGVDVPDFITFDESYTEDNESINEERNQWEQLEGIRSMPVSMDVKRDYRTRLQQTPVSPATGLVAWELTQQKARKRVTDYWKEVKSQLHLWSKSMKTIEGRYGTGVVSYFIFLRWLLYLNLLIFLSVLVLIVFPQAFSPPTALSPFSPTTSPNLSVPPTTLTNAVGLPYIQRGDTQDLVAVRDEGQTSDLKWCWERYKSIVRNKTDTKVLSRLQDFVQGTGWMEATLMFPGWYNFRIDNLFYQKEEYKLSLAYILVTLAYFLVCLVMMVIYTTQGVRETLMTSEGHLNRYCNLVFCGWDYCIEGRANAQRKHHSIIQEVKSNLAEERRRAEVAEWSHMKKAIIYSRRLLINIVVLVGLGAAGYLIYDVCKMSLNAIQGSEETDNTDVSQLLNEFLPSLTITGLNIVLPTLFTQICILEKYSVAFEIKITLIRTVFLRLASVGVLVVTMYYQVTCEDHRKCNSCERLPCWETYVGQQMYKLVILDFIVTVVMILLIELPRMLIVKHCKCKLAEFIGRQEFDIPKHVLDLVYSQTLCWLGTFYSPLLPAVCVLKYIFFFYLKKFTLLVNCVPSKIPYRASRSNTFFMIVLMLSFLLASIPLWYSVANVAPSRGCGPFRPYNTMWDPITDTVQSWPNAFREIFKFLVSVGFAAPVLIMLCLATYYYSTVSAANKKMIRVLRDQLVLEGTDKQFLLARLAEVAKRRHNSVDQL